MKNDHVVSRRGFIGGGLAASVLATLAACGKRDGSTGQGKKGGTLKYYINNPVAIDPYNTQEDQGTQVEHILFDALVGYDWDKHEVVGKAAESWEVNDDDTVFTFHLVKGATFHNGDAVDAASFKRGWERIVNPKMATPSEINYHLAPVKGYDEFLKGTATEMEGLKAVDDTTFEVTLSSSMADFLTVCTHSALAPVPQAALDDPESFLVAPIGNGPFKMDGQWVADQYINVVRFDDYYGEKAKLDGINFSIQKDPDTAFREFEGGNIDMAQIPTGRFNETIEKYGKSDDGYTVTPGHQTLTGAELSVYYLAINIEKMPDKNLRHAVSLAIDRQSICDTLFEGTRIPADSVIPTVLDPDGSNAWADCRYDKDAAQKLIDDNGLAGTEVTLSYNSGGGHEDIMSMVQSDLEAVGLKVQQESQEWASYLQKLKGGDFTMGRLGWIADYPTIDNMLYPNFYSTADNNYSKYKDDEVDQGIDDARQIADEEERKAKLREVNQLIGEDMPIVPLMFYAHNWVGSERVESLYLDPQNKVDFVTTTLKA